MGASSEVSFVVSLCTTVVLVAVMQMYKHYLGSTQWLTIVGGYLGSLVFIFLLTAISNLEMSLFGKQFQTKFVEVGITLVVSCFISGLIHRVSITTCIIFSMVALYYINRLSIRRNQVVSIPANAANPVSSKKKK
ncbi:protein KRTCAP2-like protein [Leptotrombidium deliense]|uniref:Protein KRTCAP2-like protein n=1 Tax=Leptotrombidium deliense TaxID=299467 RepID=A0A443SW89_9ACAR|nr:protein KRTCAP2-like protein [Leptotrombidium deliense]